MKRLFLAATALLALPAIASAADLTPRLKASPLTLDLNVSGFYFGVYTIGGMGSVQGSAFTAPAAVGVTPSGTVALVGVNPNSIVANEAAVGGLVGYAWAVPNSTMFFAVEAMFGWNNINGNTQGFAFSGPAAFKQRALVGAPVSTIASIFPNIFPFVVPPFPPLPNGAVVTNIKPYLYGALNEDDVSLNVPAGILLSDGTFTTAAKSNSTWGIAPEIGIGALGQLTATTVIDVFAGAKFPQKGACVGLNNGLACAGLGTTAVAGLAFKW